ncbi:hypothetical protein HAX54_021513 [Datura stramonium]|uniref:Uncharacterized protein n=1 Tax=Datura stramonium TaxID=4076 RepID=A0ABS8Y687_DATST|nr:hypothetical protein [Datura stramonium]
MEMEAWPEMIETIKEFCDDSRMVFCFGNTELTPTLEEVLDSFESLRMKSRRVRGTTDMAQNRFESGYDKLCKAWLKKNLQMTLTPGTNTYDQVEDVESKGQSLGILHPVERGGSRCEPRDEYKQCDHIDHRGYTTYECSVLRTKIHEMINSGQIIHMWGPHAILACDQVKPETPITEDARIHLLDFIGFEESYAIIYQKLIDAKIIYPFEKKRKSSVKQKDEETFPYHSREVRHTIKECRIFRFYLEHLIQTENIWVKFPSNRY